MNAFRGLLIVAAGLVAASAGARAVTSVGSVNEEHPYVCTSHGCGGPAAAQASAIIDTE